MFRSWLVLFIAFVIYSCMVYSYCDKRPVSDSIPPPHALAGWKTWQAKNCQACHQLYGLGGYLGPDLTNVTADTNKKEIYFRTFIKYGTGKMPNFHLNDSEINNLISFLYWIDKSGKSKVGIENVTWSGNYNIEK